MKQLLMFPVALLLALTLAWTATSQQKNDGPKDRRLKKVTTLNDYFPFTPPKSLKEWQKRRQFVKAQVQVANGLLPLPTKTALKPVIHGKIKRDGYTIEKVYFQSYPGFYVTGNLYRPTGLEKGQMVPGVLCPHGHWGDRNSPKTNGRFYKAGNSGDRGVTAQIKKGAEKTEAGAMYPLQARCAQLARLGCVVFHYDMVGYADSTQIFHPLSKLSKDGGFGDADAALWQQNFMGLQTWNSIRALDFLTSLSEVDAKRIGVTGASGGGTQTFILCAVDNRPAAAFPAVMVSTGMQGGCICENCSYLRLNSGNIELAGLFAPKPLAMSAAKDWTHELETKGLPELKQLYKLYGRPQNIAGKAFLQFGHNYNQVAREMMYNWFNKHLKLGHKSPIVERPFVPVPPEQLSVWDEQHPRPKDAKTAMDLRDYTRNDARRQLATLYPQKAGQLKRLRKITGTALQVMMNETGLPEADDIEATGLKEFQKIEGGREATGFLSRKGQGERVRAVLLMPAKHNGTIVVSVHAKTGSHRKAAAPILAKGAAVLAIYPFTVGDDVKIPAVSNRYRGYTWGYNRTILANRVHDILTAVAYVKRDGVKDVHLLGHGRAGPWVILARALCGDAVARTAADMNRFRFAEILSMHDDMMQPGALKYGDMPAFTALCAPHELFLHNTRGIDSRGWISAAYRAAGQASRLRQESEPSESKDVVSWLLK